MLSFPPLKLEIIGVLAVRVVFFLVPSLLFFLFDSLLPSLAVGIKTQGAPALPTRTGGVKSKKRRGSQPEWYQIVGISIFNVCLGVSIQAAIELLLSKVLNVRSVLQISSTLPMPWTIAKGVVRGLILREVSEFDHPPRPSFLLSSRNHIRFLNKH